MHPQNVWSGVRTLCIAILLSCLSANPGQADCPAAPLETATDLVVSFLTDSTTQAGPATLFASTVEKGMLVYDGNANALKFCDGTNWLTLADTGGAGANAAGLAGYVQISDGSGGLTYSGSTAGQEFFWDNTNKRLGIGTATPPSRLTVHGGGLALSAAEGDVTLSFRPEDQSAAYSNTADERRLDFMQTGMNGGVFGYKLAWRNADGSARLDALSFHKDGGIGIGVTSPNPSALLTLNSTTKGFLPPRMTEGQRDAIASPATGLVVYNTDDNALNYWDGDSWEAVGTGAGVGGSSVYFQGTRTETQSVGNSVWTSIIYSTQASEAGGDVYDTGTGEFTAPSDGFYQFNASVSGAWITTTSLFTMYVRTTGGAVICWATNSHDGGAASMYAYVSCSGGIYLTTGTKVHVQAYQTSGGAKNLGGTFSGFKVDGGGPGGGSTTLAGLTDVDLSALADGKVLTYDNDTGKWVAAHGGGSTEAAGDAGQIQFNDGSDGFAADANLHWDNTNKRLGIGTATPLRALDVRAGNGFLARLIGTADSNNTYLELHNDGVTPLSTGIVVGEGSAGLGYLRYAFQDSEWQVYAGGGTSADRKMVIEASGNVGIGTTVPQSRLHVDGGIQLGDDSDTCPGASNVKLGTLRFNSGALQICTIGGWRGVGGGVPTGTIAAFAAASCPDGWAEYTPARGRFLRGIDNGAGIDGAGTRAPGHQQEATEVLYRWGRSGGWHYKVGDFPDQTAGFDSTRQISSLSANYINSDGSNNDTYVRLGKIRPANVAVLFCQYTGTGGGGTDTLAGLSCSTNEIPKWNGSAWACAADEEGGASAEAAGDDGQIQFNDGSDAFAADASLHWDDANKRLGIGTTSPADKLHVQGGSIRIQRAVDSAASDLLLTGAAGTDGWFISQRPSSSRFGLVENTGGYPERLTVLAGGNVGIGTATPSAKLDVNGTVRISGSIESGTETGGLFLSGGPIASSTAARLMLYGGSHATFPKSMYLDADTINFRPSDYSAINMTINAAGNVGIGTVAITSRLDVVNSAANVNGLRVLNSGSGSSDAAWLSNATPGGRVLALHKTGGTGDIMHAYYDGGGGYQPRLTLNNAGALWIAGALTQNSDMTLKTDVANIPDALEKISRLRGVSYQWKDPQRGTERQLGLLAQEVEKIFPEVVSTQADGTKGVAYTSLIGPLIESIKELKADNDNLRAELKAANDNYQDLRREIDALKVAR